MPPPSLLFQLFHYLDNIVVHNACWMFLQDKEVEDSTIDLVGLAETTGEGSTIGGTEKWKNSRHLIQVCIENCFETYCYQ